jgi:hypothetical protein
LAPAFAFALERAGEVLRGAARFTDFERLVFATARFLLDISRRVASFR